MKFAIDCQLEVDDTLVSSTTVLEKIDEYREALGDPAYLEAKLLLSFDDEEGATADYTDPVFRLIDGWLRRVQWVLAGDTETLMMRNSAHCFAFVPAGNAVEISFFEGDAAEIEEYVLEPTNVLLTDYVPECIRIGEHVVELAKAIDPALLESNEDCKDVVRSLGEAQKAWKDYQVHQRR